MKIDWKVYVLASFSIAFLILTIVAVTTPSFPPLELGPLTVDGSVVTVPAVYLFFIVDVFTTIPAIIMALKRD